MTDEVPTPAGVALLPTDERGVPTPAHVARVVGRPVRLSALDPDRLAVISERRRCTICGWSIPADERCWFVTPPAALAANEAVGWQGWATAGEGGGHLECLLYSCVVCPFLCTPEATRKTTRVVAGDVDTERGVPRGDVALAGYPEMRVVIDASHSKVTLGVRLGGGEPEVLTFAAGVDLLGALQRETRVPRKPSDEDRRFAALITSPDSEELAVAVTQTTLVVAARCEVNVKAFPRNEPCPCGLGAKYKHCCLPRVDAARAAPYEWALGRPAEIPLGMRIMPRAQMPRH